MTDEQIMLAAASSARSQRDMEQPRNMANNYIDPTPIQSEEELKSRFKGLARSFAGMTEEQAEKEWQRRKVAAGTNNG